MSPAQLLQMFDYRNSVAHAAERCGGPERLAREVNAWPEQVVHWSLGLEQPSTVQLLRILELARAKPPAGA
jgi:hypothetical protein